MDTWTHTLTNKIIYIYPKITAYFVYVNVKIKYLLSFENNSYIVELLAHVQSERCGEWCGFVRWILL